MHGHRMASLLTTCNSTNTAAYPSRTCFESIQTIYSYLNGHRCRKVTKQQHCGQTPAARTYLTLVFLQFFTLLVTLDASVADVDLVAQEVSTAALARTAHAHLLYAALGRRTGARVADDITLVIAR